MSSCSVYHNPHDKAGIASIIEVLRTIKENKLEHRDIFVLLTPCEKSFKKIVSAVLAASMTLTSVMVVNVAPVTAAEAFSGKATINAETVKTLFASGLTDGNELGSGVSIVNGGSAFTYKANNLKFTDGSAYSTEFQIGNGNEKLSQTLKAGDDLGGVVEKGLKIEAAKAGTIKIYAGLGSSGVMEAPMCLVDAATSKVVDAQSLINTGDAKSKVYNTPTFTVPAAGTYYLVQNGKVSSINLAGSTRPLIYSMVFSSTGKIPFLPPASMAMLEMVKRSSMDREDTPSPVNSRVRQRL